MVKRIAQKNDPGNGYSSDKDYYFRVAPLADERGKMIEQNLGEAFAHRIKRTDARLIILKDLSSQEFASIIIANPTTLKPLMTLVGIAARSVERDLGIRNLDTYQPRLEKLEAFALAEYLLALLPEEVLLESLVDLDRAEFIDKEKRKNKGSWEKVVTEALCRVSGCPFCKRKIVVNDEIFEIDAAYTDGDNVLFGVDIKRIEARRDFQKRSDEIVNKAKALKSGYPNAKFATIVYYPFEHDAVRSRLRSENIDIICFATDIEETINQAAKDLVDGLGIKPSLKQSHFS